jgi:hypothetical protein
MSLTAFAYQTLPDPASAVSKNPRVVRSGDDLPQGRCGSRRFVLQTLKLEPQPQVDLVLGLLNLKPAPCRPST